MNQKISQASYDKLIDSLIVTYWKNAKVAGLDSLQSFMWAFLHTLMVIAQEVVL